MTVLTCPDCEQPYAPGKRKSAVERLAKHIYHSGEPHPDVEYGEARSIAEQQGLPEDHDDDGEIEAAGDGDAPDPDAERFDPTADAPEGNPLLRAPQVARSSKESRGCPECGQPMDVTASGHRLRGVTEEGRATKFVTEEGDEYCPECSVLRSKDGGEIIRGVSEQ